MLTDQVLVWAISRAGFSHWLWMRLVVIAARRGLVESVELVEVPHGE